MNVRPVDPARSRVVLVGTPVYDDPALPDVPVVANNLTDLAEVFLDATLGGFSAENVTIVPARSSAAQIGSMLVKAAAEAEDLLLFYYSGHGLLSPENRELYLSLADTRLDQLVFSALRFDAVRWAFRNSQATNRAVILDSCFSGRAIGETLADEAGTVLNQLQVSGTYILTSAPANRTALILPGERHTAFTGRLLNLFRTGTPDAGPLLSFGDIYRHLHQQLSSEQLPVPQQRGTETADLLGLIRNRHSLIRNRNSPQRLGLLSDLRKALDAGRIEVHYQPQASFKDERLVGVEALARWRHDVRGAIPPETFVKLAESSGLMSRLTEYVLDISLRQAALWWENGYGVPIAVNVSLRDIENPDFVDLVAHKLVQVQHRIRPEALRLEIAERVLVGDAQSVRATLIGLSELGVRLSLDNFGTGYASLLTLRRLPFDEIKIDRSFVGGIGFDADDAAIVRSTIDLAHSLGLRVVAEGVEDPATWSTLEDYGCDEAQGWLVAKALPASEISALLRQQIPATGPTT